MVSNKALKTSSTVDDNDVVDSKSDVKNIVNSFSESFGRFGDDLSRHLLSYLPIEETLRFRCVGKHFQTLVSDSQTILTFDALLFEKVGLKLAKLEDQRCRLFRTIVENCPKLTKVEIRDLRAQELTNDYLDVLVKHCRNLKHIEINVKPVGKCKLTADQIDRFMDTFSNQLTIIETNDCLWKLLKPTNLMAIHSAPFVKKLTVESADRYHNGWLTITLDQLFADNKWLLRDSLREIAFRLTPDCMQILPLFVANYEKQILKLDLEIYGDFDRITVETLIYLLSQMSSLRKLQLILYKTNIKDNIQKLLTQLGVKCRQLKVLDLILDVQIDVEKYELVLSTIGTHMKQLKQLSICGNDDDNDEDDDEMTVSSLTSASLKEMKQLTHFSLRIPNLFIGQHFFDNIDHHLPRLQYLNISYTHLSERVIKSVAKLKHLHDICLDYCYHKGSQKQMVTETVVNKDLIGSRPNVANVYISYSNSSKNTIKIGTLFDQLMK